MSKAAISVLVFGGYLGVLGAILVVVPNVLLGIFGIPATREIWIRVLGVLVLALAFYYSQAARQEVRPFFRWSVWVRAIVFSFFIAFVLLGLAPSVLILFGTIDALGALWTARALRDSDGSAV